MRSVNWRTKKGGLWNLESSFPLCSKWFEAESGLESRQLARSGWKSRVVKESLLRATLSPHPPILSPRMKFLFSPPLFFVIFQHNHAACPHSESPRVWKAECGPLKSRKRWASYWRTTSESRGTPGWLNVRRAAFAKFTLIFLGQIRAELAISVERCSRDDPSSRSHRSARSAFTEVFAWMVVHKRVVSSTVETHRPFTISEPSCISSKERIIPRSFHVLVFGSPHILQCWYYSMRISIESDSCFLGNNLQPWNQRNLFGLSI